MNYATFLILVVTLSVDSSEALEFIAHRANYDFPIENSIEATRRALTSSVDAIELDVRVSNDGVVYLYHDDEIDGKELTELSFEQVRTLASISSTPTLEEVLSLGEPRSFYLLDLKIENMDSIESLVSVVRASDIEPRKIAFQSHSLEILQQLEHKAPLSTRIYLSSLKRTTPFFLLPTATKLLASMSGYAVDGISLKGRDFLNLEYISSLKEAGLRVYVWTINDFERIQYYVTNGVDGVITDNYREIEKRLAENPNLFY